MPLMPSSEERTGERSTWPSGATWMTSSSSTTVPRSLRPSA